MNDDDIYNEVNNTIYNIIRSAIAQGLPIDIVAYTAKQALNNAIADAEKLAK